MKEMRQDRLAFDLQSARKIDPHSGHMHVQQTNISKATINPYNGSEIPGADELGLDPDRVYRLLRHPDELEKAAKSFDGKPLVLMHKAQAADDKDHLNRVGSVGSPVYEHPYLKANLAVWDQEAIDAIESGAQRELSCGYAYTPDMTPGTYEGERYDGIMRNLGGNHVALVREGRAGADCHVFDSMEKLLMSKSAVSRTQAFERALSVTLRPRLAQDVKINWAPAVKGLTAKNFAEKKAKLAADIKAQTAGKMAKDADLQDVVEVIEALAPMLEGDPAIDPNAVSANPVEDEDDDKPDLAAILKEMGILDDDIAKVVAKMSGGGAQDDAPSNMGSGSIGGELTDGREDAGGGSTRTYAPTDNSSIATGGAADEDDDKKDKDKKAMDARIAERLKGMVSKSAMDSAIATAVKSATDAATARVNAIHEAKTHVRQWVGEQPALTFDSADSVYRAALKSLNVPNVDKLHADALRPILDAQPKPGDKLRNHVPAHIAQDAAAKSEYTDRYGANASRLKN